MYDSIKKELGPILNKTTPLRSSTGEVITDRGHQLERWVEHYSDIYSRENIVSRSALDVECLQTMEELDKKPTLEELSKAIDSLAFGNAPGSHGIPPDLIKHCKTTLLHSLHVLLCQCCTVRHEGRQDHHTLQEQLREERLQQLQRHLPSQCHWQSLCKGHLDPTAEAGRTCLS